MNRSPLTQDRPGFAVQSRSLHPSPRRGEGNGTSRLFPFFSPVGRRILKHGERSEPMLTLDEG